MIRKLIQAVSTLILVIFALLQLNDPDSLVWTGFYLLCGAVPALALFKAPNRIIFWCAVTVSFTVMAIHLQGAYTFYLHSEEEALMQSMSPEKPYIEQAREFLGALIALCLIVFNYILQENPPAAPKDR